MFVENLKRQGKVGRAAQPGRGWAKAKAVRGERGIAGEWQTSEGPRLPDEEVGLSPAGFHIF